MKQETLEIIKNKGLSISEVDHIQIRCGWETCAACEETFEETLVLYWHDEDFEKYLQTKEGYELLK